MTEATELSDGTRTEERLHKPLPVHPWGALLLLSADWRVDGLSDNIGKLLSADPRELLGRPIASTFTSAAVHAIRNRFALLGGSGGSERLFGLQLTEGGKPLDLLLHLAGQHEAIELFPAADTEGLDVAALVSRMVDWIEGCGDIVQLGDRAAHAIRGTVGCDSVSILKSRGGDDQPETIACYARDGFECPPRPHGPLGEQVQFIGACTEEPAALLLRDGARAPDLSGSLLGGDVESLREYVCANGGASGFQLPITCASRTWGWVVGLQRHERSLALARLSVIELFAKYLAAEIGRLEAKGR